MCHRLRKSGETHLGFHVVGNVVHSASEWDFTDRPGGVVGEVSWQDADPQLPLVENKRWIFMCVSEVQPEEARKN